MRFDPTQPYAESMGIPGVRYEQNGRRFDPGGREVMVKWGAADGVETMEVCEVPSDPEDDEPTENGPGFRGMHWKQLKALVEVYDHEWVDKADAVRFLESRV